MPTMDIIHTHSLHVKYMTPTKHRGSRFKVSWYDQYTRNRQFRYIDYDTDAAKIAHQAANCFMEWFNNETYYTFTSGHISIASVDPDCYTVHVETVMLDVPKKTD